MPTALGIRIRTRRQELTIGVREFAKLIGKSPAFITNLEMDDRPPSVSEETLREIARKLTLDPDELITLAGKLPQDLTPESVLDVALYRRVKGLSEEGKQQLLDQLDRPSSPHS